MSKKDKVRQYVRPTNILEPSCSLCSKVATKEIFVEMADFAIRQRYCDECLTKIETDIGRNRRVRSD
jgi:hypothetical protein